jgi:uncharacterized protein
MNQHGVVHFEIPADDPEKLVGFYKQLFGWEVDKMDMEGMPYWSIRTGPMDETTMMPKEPGYIGGGMAKRISPQQHAVNYVNVEDVNQYVQKAQSLGAQVSQPRMAVPGMGYFAHLVDPEGNTFGVWQNDMGAK